MAHYSCYIEHCIDPNLKQNKIMSIDKTYSVQIGREEFVVVIDFYLH